MEGPARVEFFDTGESRITMEVADFCSEKSLTFGLMEFLHGGDQASSGEAGVMHFSTEHNPCTLFRVTTPQGTFTTSGNVMYSYSDPPLGSGEGRATLTLRPLRSRFDAAESGLAKYWVLPVLNFLSEFHHHDAPLGGHPLRIWQEPAVPSDLTEEQDREARFMAEWQDRLIIFGINGHLGFIEPLADYDDRASRLCDGTERNLMTAVVVGETNQDIMDPHEEHFQLNILRVLSFVTGAEVGTASLEFRDTTGALVSRSHAIYGDRGFAEGRAPMRESIHVGTGRLLNNFFLLPENLRYRMHSAMNHAVQSGLHGRNLEDRLSDLFRGLDGLCGFHGLASQNLGKRLDRARLSVVKQALRTAAGDIKEAADRAAAIGDHEQSRTLRQIAERTTSNPPNVDRNFGLAIVDLARKLGFPDADVLDRYYQAHPRHDGRSWDQMLSAYRGRITHEGPLSFPRGHDDVEDAINLLRHLHDLFTRMILKMIGYDGMYNPWATDSLEALSVDWVTPDTDATRLGYGRREK